MEAQFARAIQMAKAGHKQQARELLIVVLNQDSSNIAAWKWFATVAASEDEARQAISSILSLNLNDAWALRALETLNARSAQRARRRQPATVPAEGKRMPAGLALVIGIGVVAVVLCVGALGMIALGPGLLSSGAPAGTPVSTVVGASPGETSIAAIPGGPTLPATWTPPSSPTLPTLTPSATPTVTYTPTATTTKVPTPESIDPPVKSELSEPEIVSGTLDTSAKVIETESVVYYSVTGSNANEINQSILANGPKNNGMDAIAQVQYSLGLRYIVLESPGLCQPAEAVGHLDFVFTYPQYNPPPGVSQEILNQWDAFLARVVTHEETHAQIARECALKLVNDFYSLSPAASCGALQNNVEALQDANDVECDARQLAFDASEGGDSFP